MPASRSVYEEAIKKATHPGGCLYIIEGEPCCVIAQLYVLKGGNVFEMKGWYGVNVLRVVDELKPPLLMDEPRSLLSSLQSKWDACETTTAEEGRELMMEVLDYFFREAK